MEGVGASWDVLEKQWQLKEEMTMPDINGKQIRELYLVKFRSSQMTRGNSNSLTREDIAVQNRVWAFDAEEAIQYVKNHPPKSPSGPLPFLGLIAVEPLGLLEGHILNQPKAEEDVQPFGGPSEIVT